MTTRSFFLLLAFAFLFLHGAGAQDRPPSISGDKTPAIEASLHLKRHQGRPQSVAVSADGRFVASGGADSVIVVWDLQSGTALRELAGHIRTVNCLAFSPDARFLVSGGEDGTVRVWNVATGQLLHTMTGSASPVTAVAFSPDGRRALSGNDAGVSGLGNQIVRRKDFILRLWDVDTGKQVAEWPGNRGRINCVAFSADGAKAISGSRDGTVRMWDVASGAELHRLEGASNIALATGISPEGALGFTALKNGSAGAWDFATGVGKSWFTLPGGGEHLACAVSGDWSRAVSAVDIGGDLVAWDPRTGRATATLAGAPSLATAVAISANGEVAAMVGWDRLVHIWRLGSAPKDAKPAEADAARRASDTWSVAWGIEPRRIWYGGDRAPIKAAGFGDIEDKVLAGMPHAKRNAIFVVDYIAGRAISYFDYTTSETLALAFSPSGTHAIAAIEGGALDEIEIKPRKRLGRTWFKEDRIRAAEYLHGRRALVGTESGKLVLVDLAKSVVARTDDPAQGPVRALSVDGESKTAVVLAGKDAGVLLLYDIATGRLLSRIEPKCESESSIAAISPDGKFAAAGFASGEAIVWDAATGREVRRCRGGEAAVTAMCFSRSGRSLLCGGADNIVRAWTIETGREVAHETVLSPAALTPETTGIVQLRFSEKRDEFLSADRLGTVRLWDFKD